MRRLAPALLAAVVAISGCAGESGASGTSVTIVVHGMNMDTPWHTTWTLQCDPPGGSHPQAPAACRALTGLIRHHAVPPRHCPSEISGPWTTVHGTYRSRTISLAYGEACAQGRHAAIEAQALGAYFAHG